MVLASKLADAGCRKLRNHVRVVIVVGTQFPEERADRIEIDRGGRKDLAIGSIGPDFPMSEVEQAFPGREPCLLRSIGVLDRHERGMEIVEAEGSGEVDDDHHHQRLRTSTFGRAVVQPAGNAGPGNAQPVAEVGEEEPVLSVEKRLTSDRCFYQALGEAHRVSPEAAQQEAR